MRSIDNYIRIGRVGFYFVVREVVLPAFGEALI